MYLCVSMCMSRVTEVTEVSCLEMDSGPLEEPLLFFILRQGVLKLPVLALADAVAPEDFEFTIFSLKSPT